MIDADIVGHEVLERSDAHRQVIDRFGAAVVGKPTDAAATSGSIDRRALGSIVFASRQALDDLEAIVHPPMRQQFEAIIDRERARPQAPALVLDAAILLEAGWDSLCDLVVFVAAAQPVRLARVARDRGWTAESLQAREAAQWPLQRKLERADIVIHNDSSLESLEQSVDHLFRLLTEPDSTNSGISEAAAGGRLASSATACSAAMALDLDGSR